MSALFHDKFLQTGQRFELVTAEELWTPYTGRTDGFEALLFIRRWLNNGQAQVVETDLTKQVQFA
jgi:hypothetical protein